MLTHRNGKDRSETGRSKVRSLAAWLERKMIKDVGSTSFVVFNFYRRAIYYENFEITDKSTAASLGMSEKTIQRSRIKLQDLNYFLEVTVKTKTVSSTYYALGKNEVVRVKYLHDLFGTTAPSEIRRNNAREDVDLLLGKSSLNILEQEDVLDTLEPTPKERESLRGGWSTTRSRYLSGCKM